jgi:phosphatidylethanolamine/phosphatidyl-N-methylethanolamine N-methyltransferase
MSDTLRFLGRLVARPVHTGAVAPSGPGLSRAMAAQIPANAEGPILELGPGTGVVTTAMIDRGIAADRITAVEYDRDFAALVASRYPSIHVINGDAFDLEKTLGNRPKRGFAAILSSMPLVNFPMALRAKLLADVLDRLQPSAPFIQFSYRLRAPVAPPAGVTVVRAAFILMNVPPARVWVYRRR